MLATDFHRRSFNQGGSAVITGTVFLPIGVLFAEIDRSQGKAEIGWLVGMKLLVHPLITRWLAYHVFKLHGALPAIAVLQAALPCGVPVFVLAQQYNTFVARSNAVIVISTVISIITLSALLLILKL